MEQWEEIGTSIFIRIWSHNFWGFLGGFLFLTGCRETNFTFGIWSDSEGPGELSSHLRFCFSLLLSLVLLSDDKCVYEPVCECCSCTGYIVMNRVDM